MEEEKDLGLDLMRVIVDGLSKTYTEISELPMAASHSPAPFKGKVAKECFEILKKLKKDTGSEINVKNCAVLDERSVEDDTVLLVQAFDKPGEIMCVEPYEMCVEPYERRIWHWGICGLEIWISKSLL